MYVIDMSTIDKTKLLDLTKYTVVTNIFGEIISEEGIFHVNQENIWKLSYPFSPNVRLVDNYLIMNETETKQPLVSKLPVNYIYIKCLLKEIKTKDVSLFCKYIESAGKWTLNDVYFEYKEGTNLRNSSFDELLNAIY